MKIFFASRFIRQFKKLPDEIGELAKMKLNEFRNNPFQEPLKTHKLKGSFKDSWAFSVNYQYRIIFEFIDQEAVLFVSVGKHNIYDQ